MAVGESILNARLRLVEAYRADPKKAMVLSVLTVVLLAIWGRMLATGSNVPSPAHATPASESTYTQQQLSAAATSTGPNGELIEWLKAPVQGAKRNLFALRFDYYPKDASANATPVSRTLKDDTFWDQLAKSMHVVADQRKERQILVQNLRERAQDLRLQSIVMSTPRKALINDQLVSEDDSVEGFRIVRIEPRRIIVEREGIKLEILMK